MQIKYQKYNLKTFKNVFLRFVIISCLWAIFDLWLNQWFITPDAYYRFGKTMPEYFLMLIGFVVIMDNGLSGFVVFTKWFIKKIDENDIEV